DSQKKPINIRGRDLAFDPRTGDFHLTSGAAQHGMCFDDWGRKFNTSNSNHITQVMYEERHVARNGFLQVPSARVAIAKDGPQAEVFRTSPVEPWRIVRTRLRVSGAVKGLIEGGGRASGYFTSATGITIYRGDAWPEEHRGTAIVGDVGSNLIHRKQLVPDGLAFTAERIDNHSEFVTSTDIWFRPVQFANAPDGSLFVVDMYREFIEHPKSLPTDIKKHLDLNSGRGRGRIYRIAPTGFRYRPTPDLKRKTTTELVGLLAHDNAWHRETASRLLYERQEVSAEAQLVQVVKESSSPLARLHALHVLHGLGRLGGEILKVALLDSHPQVRRNAVRLAELSGLLAELAPELLKLADDDSIEVRAQLAFAAGGMSHPGRNIALAKIIRRDVQDRWIRMAVQCSLDRGAHTVFTELVADRSFRSTSAQLFLTNLSRQLISRSDSAEVEASLDGLALLSNADGVFALPIIGQFLSATKHSNSIIARMKKDGRLNRIESIRDQMILVARETAADPRKPVKDRVAAIQSLTYGEFAKVGKQLGELLGSQNPHQVQLAALKALQRFDETMVVQFLIESWKDFSPKLRRSASELVFSRKERISAMFDAVDTGVLTIGDLDPARLKMLRKSGDRETARRADEFLNSLAIGDRADVVAAYQDCMEMVGEPDRGKKLFKLHCASCHRLEGVGFELGPNLASMQNRGPQSILVNVLDPSREVNPEFLNYMMTTKAGKVTTGMIVAESANSITLRRGADATETVLRKDIDELRSTGESIMPTGLEKLIDKQAISDLIAYLMGLGETQSKSDE
ncbi:MAG: PVC-type heme-binding CxxCH protein, partial [Planctomycetota bacterium]